MIYQFLRDIFARAHVHIFYYTKAYTLLASYTLHYDLSDQPNLYLCSDLQ
jgi:hypothetical protein